LCISILIANGVGWLIFGTLMVARVRDDEAGPSPSAPPSLSWASAWPLSWRGRGRQQHQPQMSR
jgi:hypothetical protein